jgi:hypothetical protein
LCFMPKNKIWHKLCHNTQLIIINYSPIRNGNYIDKVIYTCTWTFLNDYWYLLASIIALVSVDVSIIRNNIEENSKFILVIELDLKIYIFENPEEVLLIESFCGAFFILPFVPIFF